MPFAILTFIVAIAIAAVAAWFSIIGLTAIFAAAVIPIIIMGSVLEVGKLVTASWLYQNWQTASFLLKTYLTSAVVILMFITSMGIFGFLSKAHLEQTKPAGNNMAKIDRLDKMIAREQKEIDDAETVIRQLDEAVAILQEYDRIRGPEGALAVRRSQSDERAELKDIIDTAQDNLDRLEDQRLVLSAEVRELELEVGPIRYVAELVYDDAESKLEDAVRWVIIILVLVFDPLAVLLLVAANSTLAELKNGKEEKNRKKAEESSEPTHEIRSTTNGMAPIQEEVLGLVGDIQNNPEKPNQALSDQKTGKTVEQEHFGMATPHDDHTKSLGTKDSTKVQIEENLLIKEPKKG